ncbi:MAG: DUF3131 domain-containing protein [Thalassovita sp.]|nr:DUF3131 domain-containing protein [Thalassovita sp.]
MLLSRRMVLKGGTALSMTLAAGVGYSDEVKVKTVFLLLDGIDPEMPPDLAEQMLERFFSRGIPVGIILQGFSDADTDSEAAEGQAPLLRRLGQVAAREPGLLELVPAFDATDDRERYFQLRQASELRHWMARSPLGGVLGERIATVVSVIDRNPENTIDPYAFRAAGFRVRIRPGVPTDIGDPISRVEPMDWGLLEIDGGLHAGILEAPVPVLELALSSDSDQLLTLSLPGAETASDDSILAASEAWADALQSAIWDGRMFFTRPSDHLLQGNPGASKYVALLLDYRDGADEGMTAFARELEAAGFPYSVLRPSSDFDGDMGAADVCYDGQGLVQVPGIAGPACVVVQESIPAGGHDVTEILLQPPGTAHAWTGLREDCRFQIALPDRLAGPMSQRYADDPLTDTVELIPPALVATVIQRSAVMQLLEEIRRDGRAHFYSVRGFMEQIVAPEPALRRVWSLRRRVVTDPIRTGALDPAEASRLLDDAQLAWRYIEKYTNETTGICVGTASLESFDPNVTFWDVGSLLFGIDAASRLGLIAQDEAKERIGRVLDNLPVVIIDGSPLPPALFSSATAFAARTAYDACDTGRFLLALEAVVKSGLVEMERALSVMERWDLPATIRDRHVFDFSGGQWVDATISHCTPYTSRGFSFWGMDVETSLPPIGPDSSGDDMMRFLHQAAFLGQYGAEPSLLAAVETGQSAEARFLSDILFDAQLSWFETRGELKAVSEAPLNFSPWFIYQGLRVDRWGDASWVINTKSESAEYDTAIFAARASLISSKSAFLWAATYPHDYSDRLLNLVREKARIADHGFSVGIFSRSLAPMTGYSDLNTNGIILTAIAHMLVPRPAE